MSTIGWVIVLGAIGLVAGSLLMLRDSAKFPPLSKERMEKVRQRQRELEEEERKDRDRK